MSNLDKAAKGVGIVSAAVPVIKRAVGWIREVVQRGKARRAARKTGKNIAFDEAVARELAREGFEIAKEGKKVADDVKRGSK